jgi:hypothetical protein
MSNRYEIVDNLPPSQLLWHELIDTTQPSRFLRTRDRTFAKEVCEKLNTFEHVTITISNPEVFIAAFHLAMQIFTAVWEDNETTKAHYAASYGSATFALDLLLKVGHNPLDPLIIHAKKLLNQAAKQMGLPEVN